MYCMVYCVKHRTNYHYTYYYGNKQPMARVMVSQHSLYNDIKTTTYHLDLYGFSDNYFTSTLVSKERLSADVVHKLGFEVTFTEIRHKEPVGDIITSFVIDISYDELFNLYYDCYNKPFWYKIKNTKSYPHYTHTIEETENVTTVHIYDDGYYYKNSITGLFYKILLNESLEVYKDCPKGVFKSYGNVFICDEETKQLIDIDFYYKSNVH